MGIDFWDSLFYGLFVALVSDWRAKATDAERAKIAACYGGWGNDRRDGKLDKIKVA